MTQQPYLNSRTQQQQVNTIKDAMALCGIDDVNLFEGATQAQRLADEVFLGEFKTCMDKTWEEFDNDAKTFSILTVARG